MCTTVYVQGIGTARKALPIPRLSSSPLIWLSSVFLLHSLRERSFSTTRVQALSSSRKENTARYFTKKVEIPPLATLPDVSTTLHSDKINMGPLPVVYTNNPKTVSKWISEYIPAGQPCTLGIDIEVSCLLAKWPDQERALRNQNINQTRNSFSCRETYSRQITIITSEL